MLACLPMFLAASCAANAAPGSTTVELSSSTTGATTSATGATTSVTQLASTTASSTTTTVAPAPSTTAGVATIAGMPPVIDKSNIYSEAAAGKLSPAVANHKAYVYVPSNDDGTVTVIDQATFKIVNKFPTGGKLVQHVVPGYDLTKLYANVSGGNFLREIDPVTGEPGDSIPVPAPYNLYFTPDGSKAIVMAERIDRIDFYDRITWEKLKSIKVPCKSQRAGFNFGGVNHADWSIDGSYFLVTCEFAGDMLKIDTASMEVIGQIKLSKSAMPQDVRAMPDGKKFYVADMQSHGVWIIDGDSFTVTQKLQTGKGAHGIYFSRDAKTVYVANRGHLANETGRRSRPGEGSVSLIDWTTDTVIGDWPVPNGGSPDMGGVSADGSTLWLSGRYDSEVYAFDTTTGALKARIKTPSAPHGLAVWPQPGRYTLGHTGNLR